MFHIMVFVLIYIYWCPTRYPYQVIIASFNRNTTGVTSGEKSSNPSGAPDSTPGFSGVRATRSLVLYICFVDRRLYFWLLCCLFFFDIRILITPLVSSNSSLFGQLQIRISKKNRQHNSQKYKRRSTKHIYKTKDRVARTPLKPGVNSGAPEG
jgi:hypothetical protein